MLIDEHVRQCDGEQSTHGYNGFVVFMYMFAELHNEHTVPPFAA